MKKIDQDPFSNGTEFMFWEDYNCDQCWKSSTLKEDGEYKKIICAIQRDIFTRMYSEEPIAERTIEICRSGKCPYRQERRKKYEKNSKEPKLF